MVRALTSDVLRLTIGVAALLFVVKALTLGEAAIADEVSRPPSNGTDRHQAAAPVPTPVQPGSPVAAPAATTVGGADMPADHRNAVTPTPERKIVQRSVRPAPEPDAHDAGMNWSVASELRDKRVALDARASSLDSQAQALAASRAELDRRMAELNVLKTQLEALDAERKSRTEQDWLGLVRIYEAMRPQNAATIFDALDTRVLLQVLDRMGVRKAALVLANMQPERARVITQQLAQMRMATDLTVKASAPVEDR